MNAKIAHHDHTIIVGIDYSELSAMVLEESVRFAAAHEHSQIQVLHAAPHTNAAVGLLSSADPLDDDRGAGALPSAEMSHDMQS